ncbi:MAG TPA: DUF2786 domain-containing protein [Rubrivivax sp.]|nr:DUF2786 domain-containing protein [Rubrivivax sp.]HRY87020.1 DUF2786 domain-containing protein [Rubrivivax sp.]
MTDQTNTPDNLEAVMRRIKKLLAFAEDSRGNPTECAAAARMAESIMRKHQIEHADVITKELQGADAFASADVGTTMDPEAASKPATARCRPSTRRRPPRRSACTRSAGAAPAGCSATTSARGST